MKAWMLLMCLLLASDAATQGSNPPAGPPALPQPDRPAASQAAGVPVFRSSADLVALNVVATDPKKRFVPGLLSDDFAIFEDGVRQDVSFFATGDSPIDLAVLLDTSASMFGKMDIMQRAAQGFAATLRDGDRAMVIDIKQTARVLHSLDGPLSEIPAAIKSTTASGGTGLYNGLYLAFRELMKQQVRGEHQRRQAIVLLSDGQDTNSLVTFDDVMEVARQAGIATYTITLRTPELTELEQARGTRYLAEADFLMRSLAQETGGEAFFPMQVRELAGVYSSIAKELASQYSLGYTPKILRYDGGFRRIRVHVADRPEIRVRTRTGYLASRRSNTGTFE